MEGGKLRQCVGRLTAVSVRENSPLLEGEVEAAEVFPHLEGAQPLVEAYLQPFLDEK
jgi:hypothetical protein